MYEIFGKCVKIVHLTFHTQNMGVVSTEIYKNIDDPAPLYQDVDYGKMYWCILTSPENSGHIGVTYGRMYNYMNAYKLT